MAAAKNHLNPVVAKASSLIKPRSNLTQPPSLSLCSNSFLLHLHPAAFFTGHRKPEGGEIEEGIGAELIGTYLLVFLASGTAALYGSDEKKVSQLGAELLAGFIVMVMVYATGHISGAHINPAVSTAFAASGHFPWKQVPFYVGVQVTGGITASFTLRLLLHPIKKLGTTSPSRTDAQALVMEILVTFILLFVICAVTTDSKAVRELAGVAIGFSAGIDQHLGIIESSKNIGSCNSKWIL